MNWQSLIILCLEPQELTYLVENFYGWNSVWCSMFSWCRCLLFKVCSRLTGRHVPHWLLAAVLVVHRRQEPFQTFNSSSLSFCILYFVFCILYFVIFYWHLYWKSFSGWRDPLQILTKICWEWPLLQLILIDTTGGCSGSKSSRWQDAVGWCKHQQHQQSTS